MVRLTSLGSSRILLYTLFNPRLSIRIHKPGDGQAGQDGDEVTSLLAALTICLDVGSGEC
jgi:hypothetical protein